MPNPEVRNVADYELTMYKSYVTAARQHHYDVYFFRLEPNGHQAHDDWGNVLANLEDVLEENNIRYNHGNPPNRHIFKISSPNTRLPQHLTPDMLEDYVEEAVSRTRGKNAALESENITLIATASDVDPASITGANAEGPSTTPSTTPNTGSPIRQA